jgi:DNA-binding transcriptional MerR regulator
MTITVSLSADDVARQVGVKPKVISDWASRGLIGCEGTGRGKGRQRRFYSKQVFQARVMAAANTIGMNMIAMARHVAMIPEDPVPGQVLVLRLSEEEERVDAIVCTWSDVDVSEGKAMLVIPLA